MCKFRVVQDTRFTWSWDIQKSFLGIWYDTSEYVSASTMEEAVGKAKYKLAYKPEVSEAYEC